MPDFTVRYWFEAETEGEQTAYVSQGVTAETLDEATRLVQDQMAQNLFTFDSDGHGRVIVNRSMVRFCSLLPAEAPQGSGLRIQAALAATLHNDPPLRLRAVGGEG